MYKKHIGHLLTVSLKYFFDFDFTIFHNAYLILLLVPFMLKLVLDAIGASFTDGLKTVKEDLTTVKHTVLQIRENWRNSDLHEHMMNNMRNLKNNLTDRNFRTH